MGTREKLLEMLEANRGVWFSGEELAAGLGVSRAAVWKAVGTLREDGCVIDAAPNRGYRLSPATDVLSIQGVQKYLEPICAGLDVSVLPEVTSTNALLREEAASGRAEGRCILANSQTAGRGRVGRSFYSPAGTGIYMSLLLRPAGCPPEAATRLTTMAAVAVAEAIEAVSGTEGRIKWVNDVFIGGKKVCGILTEAAFGLETGLLDYAVLGVGVNAYPPPEGFPAEIADIAGAVFDGPRPDGKNRLAAAILNRFMAIYTAPGDYVDRYRARSLLPGREILVLRADGARRATALGVDEDCRLLVRYDTGETARLSSGEVSLRLCD